MKVLNIFIWMWNCFKYFAHLENYRNTKDYKRYDPKNDTKYF